MDDGEWYWCFHHQAAEPAAEVCPATERLGPYTTRAEAEDWRTKVEARNEAWDEADRQWEGEDE